MKKLLLILVVVLSLFATTVAYADYTGPNRQGGDPPATADGSLVCSVPGSNGWCRNGYLKFTANEPVDGYVISAIETDLWGYVCQPNTASPTCTYRPGDGAGTVTFWAESTYGDSSTQYTLSWKLDTTAPVLTPSVPAPDGQNGWFISHPTVDVSGNDTTSGVAAVQCRVDGEPWQSPPVTVVGEGGRVVECRVVDNAGNDAVWSETVKIDTIPPTANPVVSGTLGANGWYVSSATVQANADDNISGVGNVEHQIDGGAWVSGDSVTLHDGVHTVAFRVTDNAGNVATTAAQTVKVDTTAPVLTPSVPAPDGQNGWYVTEPQIDASGSDATSGLAWLVCRVDRGDWEAPPVTVTGDGSHTVDCQAVDNAGNAATWSGVVKVDTTAPTLSLSVPTPDGQNGWFVSPATVVAHALDTTSGVAQVEHQIDGGAWTSGDSVTLHDGVHTVAFRAIDTAGNITTSAVMLKVDTIAPTLTLSVPAPDGQNGWFITSPVSVVAAASDTTSGIASLVCNVDESPWQSPPVSVAGDGSHTVDCRATDSAGNSIVHSEAVKIDTTPPTANPVVSGTLGANGWYVSSATVQANADDNISGVGNVEHQIDGGAWVSGDSVTLHDGIHTVAFRVTDNAGNVATTAAQTVKVDATAPTASPATSGTIGNNGWYTTTATVQANASDATSGVAKVEHKVDGGVWREGGSVTLRDGIHTVAFRVTDNAGNVATTAAQTVKVDTIAPTLTLSVPTPDGQNGWYVTEPQIDASGSDATSGLALLQCRVDGGEWQNPPVSVTGDGTHTVDCQAVDNAGNTAAWSDTVKVDTTPPLSSLKSPAEGAVVWGVVALQGVVDDAVSGVATVEVSTDGGEIWEPATLIVSTGRWTEFWDTRQLPDGTYTLMVRARDKAGNLERALRLYVTVANAPPEVSLCPGQWYFWQTARADVTPNPYIPLKSVTVSVLGPAGYVRRWHYGAVRYVDIHWNARWYSENGEWAHPGKYRVVVEAVDVYGHSGSAKGVVIVPRPAPTATPTPLAALAVTSTPTPTFTPTASLSPTPVRRSQLPTVLHPAKPAPPTVSISTPPAMTSGKRTFPKATLSLGLIGGILALLAWPFVADPRPKPTERLAKTITQINRYLKTKEE